MRPSSAAILGRVAEDGKVGRKGGLTWHDLRHEFVSFLVDQGGEIHEVREAARHKDIRTTERYMKAREVRLKALMSKLSTTSRAQNESSVTAATVGLNESFEIPNDFGQ